MGFLFTVDCFFPSFYSHMLGMLGMTSAHLTSAAHSLPAAKQHPILQPLSGASSESACFQPHWVRVRLNKIRGLQKIHIFLIRWIRVYPSLSPPYILPWFLRWKGESEWKLASWVLFLSQTRRGHPKPAVLCVRCISSLKTISSGNLILACKTLWWNPGTTTNYHPLSKFGSGPALLWASKTEWHRPLWE